MVTFFHIFISFFVLFSKKCVCQYQTPEPEWDILNQHTFDGWDWFLYVFCFCCAGCLCFAAGWIWHAKHVKNLIVKDADVLEYSTPIPNTPSRKRAGSDYPQFPESAWEHATPSEVKKPYTTPQIVVTDTNGKKMGQLSSQCGYRHLPQLSAHTAVSENRVLTYKTQNTTILLMPMETSSSPSIKQPKNSAPKVPSKKTTETNNSIPHIKVKNISILSMKKEQSLKEEDEDTATEIGRNETIRGIKSPSANEESESHFSMDMYMRASSQHVGQSVLTPNTPDQVQMAGSHKDNSPYGDLETNLSPVFEEHPSSKSMKEDANSTMTSPRSLMNKLQQMMAYSSASRHDREELHSGSIDIDVDELDMNSGNKMVYTDYENGNESEKEISVQMLEAKTPENDLELPGLQNSTRL